ncbi:MAG: hypothetical protein ACOC5J_03270, partial [Gemmatimonadota bacterium]
MLVVGLFALGGCDALIVDPASSGVESTIQFTFHDSPTSVVEGAGDPTDVIARVDEIQFRFLRGDEARDTTARGRFSSGTLKARVRLRPEEATGWLEVQTELRTTRRPLFRGHTLLQ